MRYMHRTVKRLCALIFVVLLVLLAVVIAGALGCIDGGSAFGGASTPRIYVRDFEAAMKGTKKYEARPAGAPYLKHIKEGSDIVVVRGRDKDDKSELPVYKFTATVTSKKEYPSIEDLVKDVGHAHLYPSSTSAKAAVEEFHKFHEKHQGSVCAIGFKKSAQKAKAGGDDYDDDFFGGDDDIDVWD